MNDIIPAILASSVSDLELKLGDIPKEINLVHVDILEEDIWTEKNNFPFEAHLMVKAPEEVMELWVERGAKRIIVHELKEEFQKFKGRVKMGLAVRLQTPLEEVFPLIPQIDFLHLMSIAEIGAQGHPLDEQIFDRIKTVREKFPALSISVDGGINTSNYHALEDCGANTLIVGSGFKELWKSLTKN
ncbi:MAG: hypothetical protein WD896_01525 [Parcubacteria group bacterium]